MDSEYGFEDIDFMLIDLKAMRHTLEKRPKEDTTPLGLIVTDDDRRAGIRDYFEGHEIDDECVEMVLKELKAFSEFQQVAMEMADSLVASIGINLPL